MSKLSNEQLAWSRKMQTRILRAIASQGQSNVADTLGVHATTVGRMCKRKDNGDDGEVEKVCNLLAAAGLKIVPQDYRMVKRSVLDSMLTINKEFYDRIGTIDDLAHDELSTRDDLDY